METSPEDWIDLDKNNKIVSRVPEGKKGLGDGLVPLQANRVAVPVMTSNEVLARTPHGGRPMEIIDLPKNLEPEEFKAVLSAAYLAYIGGVSGAGSAKGTAIGLNEVKRYLSVNLSDAKLQKVIESEAFKRAALARGVELAPRPGITPEQDLALAIITDPTAGVGLAQRLKKAGVTMAKYRAWLRQPVFRNYVQKLGDGVLKEFEHDIMNSLAGLAVDGDLNAIKYAFEVSGKHNPRDQQIMDVQAVMRSMMLIIQKHVKDPETLQAIGSEIMMLAGASGAASDTKEITHGEQD